MSDSRWAERLWHEALRATSYADSVAVIAQALTQARADTRVMVLRDNADSQRRRLIEERNRTLADARAFVEREVDSYPDASPAITSGIWGGFDQWAMGEYGTLADPDRRLCGTCGGRHTQAEYDDAHRNDEGGF